MGLVLLGAAVYGGCLAAFGFRPRDFSRRGRRRERARSTRSAKSCGREDARIDLAQACLMIAQDAYPELDGRALPRRDRAHGDAPARAAAADAAAPRSAWSRLNEFLFGELGFRGNTDDYYDPRNSYLNEVIDRQAPASRSRCRCSTWQLGRRVGLPLEGVSFPGHFLVRLRLRGGVLVLDPFAAGAPQSEDGPARAPAARDPAGRRRRRAGEPSCRSTSSSSAASNRQILARVLRNLKAIYRETDKPERLLEVLNRMLLVAPGRGRGAARPRHRLPAPRVLPRRAEGPQRLRRARARCARPRRGARAADGAVGALRAAQLGLQSALHLSTEG